MKPMESCVGSDSNSSHPMRYHIPKRIIQIGKDINLPLRNRAAVTTIRLLNPDYEYLFFDNLHQREFVEREFPQYLTVFDSFRFVIQRCDFFRYLAVYRYGGFYFDPDVLLASGLSDLLEHGCVFPFEALTISKFLRDDLGMDWLIGNYAFGAAPGHVFLEAVIENCVRGQRDTKWVKPMMRGSPPLMHNEFFILNSTGPGLVSRTLADDVCDVSNCWNRFGNWGVHLADSSWRENRSFVHQKFSGYCWRWIQYRNVQRARRLGKSRSHPCTPPCAANTT
jgi:hypothetical protein